MNLDKKQKNIDFLVELHKNVQMGRYALELILGKCKDESLREILLLQYHDFEKLSLELTGALVELGDVPKSSNGTQNFMLKFAINSSTLSDDSSEKLANMLIQGDNQGIMDVNRLINDARAWGGEKSHCLARKVLETEQRHIDNLKKFL